MRVASFLCLFVSLVCTASAIDPAPVKPPLKVAADGFPAGQATPEGAACDLARSFIKADAGLFTATCLPAFGGKEAKANYQQFLDGVTASMKAEAAKDKPSPGGPEAIATVFAARHLSREGPASYGEASFGFEDVMFVDVVAVLHDKRPFRNRTLVIKKKGQWYVLPAPDAYPLLSTGLNEEDASTRDFSDAYQVEK